MLIFGKKKVGTKELYSAKKKKRKKETWDVNVDNIVISKLVETKNNSKYLTVCSYHVTYVKWLSVRL